MADPDLPGATANNENIESGALIIAMDQTNQAHATTVFNLKAYGLVNNLLQNKIPVKWAIKAGKAKDGTDFTASTTLLLPTAGSTASRTFTGGPFIIPKAFATAATTLINTFNTAEAAADRVDVYRLEADTSIDIRYTLTFKPKIGINLTNASIHSNIFDEASFPGYTIGDVATITGTSCITMHCEPHNDASPASDVNLVRAFVLNGGNFMAQCASTEHFEEAGALRFQTTTGVTKDNLNAAITAYDNPDLAYSQYVGVLNGSTGGSHRDWTIDAAFANSGHSHALTLTSGVTRHAATQSKLIAGIGGNTFYLGGHEYGDTAIGDVNGKRMLLNAALVPANRPGCGFDFAAVAGLVFNDANNNGVQDGGELGLAGVTVTITSTGGGAAVVVVTDSSGNYSASISPGTATVDVTIPATYSVTTANDPQSFSAPSGAITTAGKVGLFNGTRVTITKISNGGTGTFTFTGTNGWTSQNIITATSGVGVAGTTQILTTSGAAVTLTESAPPTGFVLTAISCTGLGAGGTATVTLASRQVVLNAAATAAGSNIACTFTNTLQADLGVTKTNGISSLLFGGTTIYTLRVTNNGPATITGAIFSDPAVTGLSKTAVVCSGTPGQCVTPPSVAQLQAGTFALPALANGEFYEVTVTATVTATGL